MNKIVSPEHSIRLMFEKFRPIIFQETLRMSWAAYESMESLQPMPSPMAPGMMQQGGQGQGQGPSQMPHQMQARPPVNNEPKSKNVELPKAPEKPQVKMEDISEYENIYDWGVIVISAILVEALVILLVRYHPDVFGKAINIWFNRFKLSAVMADIITILVGFGITRYVYSEFVYPKYKWEPVYFTGLSAIIHVIYVTLFYFVIVRPTSQGQNTMIDVLKETAVAGGYKILGADALKMITTVFGAMVLKSAPLHITTAIGIVSLYIIPFMLETKNIFSNIA